MYEKILVPLDGSKLGEKALPYVEELACMCVPEKKAEVTLLQVITELTHPAFSSAKETHRLLAQTDEFAGIGSIPYDKAEMEQLKKQSLAYLNTAAKKIKKNKGVSVKTTVRVGADAANEILKASNQVKANLIVISTHGRSGIGQWAFGSVADKVLRGGNTPVLMVRAGTK